MNAQAASVLTEQRRDEKSLLRTMVLDLCERADATGRAVAQILGMAESTLRFWCERARSLASGVLVRLRGRPRREANSVERHDILSVIHAAAGRVGVADLKRHYPRVGRAALRGMVTRYRRVMRKRRRRGLEILSWTDVGSVWAMDFTEIEGGVEDCGRHVLVIRDLASGMTLAALPCRSQDAINVMAVLDRLLADHGAPLVLKCDNGSGFVAAATRELLARHGVLALYSPPGTPSYNGACEAGVGSIKHRAQDLAARRGPCAGVTIDDLLAAQQQANQQAVARRAGSPARQDLWAARTPVAAEQRANLCARRHALLDQLCEERGIASFDDLGHAEQASLDRFAIGKALRELNLLMTRRR